jgi:hypothetical protein
MNEVETWFSIISRKAIRRLLDAWNQNSKPFVWVKSAEQILGRIDRQRFKMTGQ